MKTTTLGRLLISTAGLAGMLWASTLVPNRASGQVTPRTLPEGEGLAAKYRGDVGIEKDPDVVFVENFEESSLDQMRARWEDVSSPQNMSFSNDLPPGS